MVSVAVAAGSGPAPVAVTAPAAPGAQGTSGSSGAQVGASAGPGPRNPVGQGNKAIGLKNCRNVTLRDFSVLSGGHFAVLATGVAGFTLENLRIDTNRDGFDIDSCRDVRIANCRVNAPNDDAIVLKTSYGLGEIRPCENIAITGCAVSGFDVGTMLDGTLRRTQERAPDRDGPTGRIKIGTESNGAFRNITIAHCTFERSRGLAFETVDGGIIEDVTVTDITMHEVTNAVIFFRLGNRARGPEGTSVGAIRRVKISRVTASGVDGRFPILLAGLLGHPIEDVTLEGIHVASRGGFTMEQVAAQPAELVNLFFLRGAEPGVTGPREPLAVPLREKAYPEPSMFGLLPASALYVRQVKNLTVRDVRCTFAAADTRPRVVLDDVAGVRFSDFDVAPAGDGAFVLRAVTGLEASHCPGLPDTAPASSP